MKIYRHIISAATNTTKTKGTTFYLVTFEQIQKYFNNEDTNIWISKAFEELEWDAIDFDNNLFGSQIIGDDLYICVTDGVDIEVGDELVYPEEALDIYTPDELSEYIKPATDEVIQKYITEFELVTPDFDKWAYDIIANNISFSKMVSDYQKFN